MESTLPIAIIPVSGAPKFPSPNGAGFWTHVADHFIPHARNNYHPHVFGNRITALFAALLITAKICAIGALAFGPVEQAFSSAITVANIIQLTNASRQDFSLSPLVENSVLDQAAQSKADDMLAKGYFSHNTPDGKTPWDFILAAGYSYISAGENLAVNFTQAENVEDAWMNSPGHKANILNKNFKEIGIGISEGQFQGHEAVFVVQMFGTPEVAKVSLSNEPTKVTPAVQPAATAVPAAQKTAAAGKTVAQSSVQAATDQQAGSGTVPVLAISDASMDVSGQTVTIRAQTSAAAVKTVAYFGDQGIMLTAKDENHWQGSVPLAQVASAESSVVVKAFDIHGKEVSKTLASFSTDTKANFAVVAPPRQSEGVRIFGLLVHPETFLSRFYLLFIAAMAVSLILAIAIKRHIQHVAVIANGSFVVILACLLYMGL